MAALLTCITAALGSALVLSIPTYLIALLFVGPEKAGKAFKFVFFGSFVTTIPLAFTFLSR